MVARATPLVRSEQGGPRRWGDDVDGGLRGGVVVDGGRGGDGGGVVIAQLLSQTVFHVFVAQRGRVVDLILQDT